MTKVEIMAQLYDIERDITQTKRSLEKLVKNTDPFSQGRRNKTVLEEQLFDLKSRKNELEKMLAEKERKDTDR